MNKESALQAIAGVYNALRSIMIMGSDANTVSGICGALEELAKWVGSLEDGEDAV